MAVYDASFRSAFALLQEGRLPDASAELRRCASAVGVIQSGLAGARPAGFAGYDEWRSWLDDLTMYTQGAQRSCEEGNAPAAREQMRMIREQFYVLHRQTNTMLCSDWIYAFRIALLAAEPDATLLRKLREQLESACPSVQAQREPTAYAKAKSQFLAAVDDSLAKGTLSPADIKTMRSATYGFLAQYGLGLN